MILERSSFSIANPDKPYLHVYYFQSWYSPIFLKDRNEKDSGNSTCITFELRKTKNNYHYLVIASLLRPRIMDSHDVMVYAKNLSNDFTNQSKEELPHLYQQNYVVIPGNDKVHNIFAAGLMSKNLPVRRLFIETNGIDIEGLMHQAISCVKNGHFYMLFKPKSKALRDLDKDFINMACSYPDPESYALVYAWAQGLVFADKYLHILGEPRAKDKSSVPPNHGYGVD